VPKWRIPPWDEVISAIPRTHPRVFVRPEGLPELRRLVATKTQDVLAGLERWGRQEIERDVPDPSQLKPVRDGISESEAFHRRKQAMVFAVTAGESLEGLCLLYLLTQRPEYVGPIRERGLAAAALAPQGCTSFRAADFANAGLTVGLAWAYDALYDHWGESDRQALREAIVARVGQVIERYRPRLEEKAFSPHPWQSTLRHAAVGALAVYHESPKAREWFEWILKMHVALYPWFGGRDGSCAEGNNYYKVANMMSSLETALLFKNAVGIDFVAHHPWYRNTGYYLLYANGVGSGVSQFGDYRHLRGVAEGGKLTTAIWASAYQDARYAAYHDAIEADIFGRPFRDVMRRKLTLLYQPTDLPKPAPLRALPKARVFPDNGLVFMRSDLASPDNDVFFEFRSSPYGSVGHAHPNQNSFNVNAYGDVFVLRSGHYHKSGDPHHRGWTRTSQAHNTILIGGKGQARAVGAYGEIVAFEIGDGFVRTVGSCPSAYTEVAVKRFDRHILWLEPDTYLIADDLETEEPQTFQWLLHSPGQMRIEGQVIHLKSGKAAGRLRFFEPEALEVSQTNEFTVPLKVWRKDRQADEFPKQWHLTAQTTEPTIRKRFVSVLQVCRAGAESELGAPQVKLDDRSVAIVLPDGREGRLRWRSH